MQRCRGVIGCGTVGRAIAHYWAKNYPRDSLIVADCCESNLNKLAAELQAFNHPATLICNIVDAFNTHSIATTVKDIQLLAIALPWQATAAILQSGVVPKTCMMVSTTRPNANGEALLKRLAEGTSILAPCGLEPGLTEIYAQTMLDHFDVAQEIHVQCGGISFPPNPPLNYQLLFGTHLSLNDMPSYAVHDGQVVRVQRYDDVVPVYVETLGKLEAFSDGMTPWMAEKFSANGIREATQKTLRWPGFAQKVKLLCDLGFCSQTPTLGLDGQLFVPKTVTQAILSPYVTPSGEFSDVTVLRVVGRGLVNNAQIESNIEIIAKAKSEYHLSSMAWLTGYTVAIIGNLLLEDTKRPTGWIKSEDYISNERLRYVTDTLQKQGAAFKNCSYSVTNIT